MFAQPIWCGEADKREKEIPGSYKLIGGRQAMAKSTVCAHARTHIYTHSGIRFSHKKEKILPFVTA